MFIEDEGRTNNGFDNKGKYKLCMTLFSCLIWFVYFFMLRMHLQTKILLASNFLPI